jgi:hypothetical protein
MLQEWDLSDKADCGQSAGKRPRGGGGCIALAFPRSPTPPLSAAATPSIFLAAPATSSSPLTL